MIQGSTGSGSNAHAMKDEHGGTDELNPKTLWTDALRTSHWRRSQMAENLAFYLGHQWVQYSEKSNRLRRDSNKSRIRMVDNIVLRSCMRRKSMLSMANPEPWVVPATEEDADASSARVSAYLLKNIFDLNRMDRVWSDLQWKLIILGRALQQVYIDFDGKAEVRDPLTKQVKSAKAPTIRIRNLPPFYYAVDPRARTWDEVNWIVNRSILSRGQALAQYGIETTEKTIPDNIEQILLNLHDDSTMERKGIDVFELYHKPTPEYPEGIYRVLVGETFKDFDLCVECGGYVRESEEGMFCTTCNAESKSEMNTFAPLPYFRATLGEIELPFVSYVELPGEIRPEGMSLTEHLLPHQRFVNFNLSVRMEHLATSTNPILVLPPRAGKFYPTNQPGQVIRLGHGDIPPSYVTKPMLSPEHSQLHRDIITSATSLASSATGEEVARSGGRTKGHAEINMQENSLIAGLISETIKHGAADMCSMVLNLAKAFYTEVRIVKIVGEDEAVSVIDFRTAHINSTDVRIKPGSVRPRDPNFELEFWKGILASQENSVERKAIMNRIGGLNLVEGSEPSVHYKRARQEFRNARKGQRLRIHIQDRHEEHIDQHQNELFETWDRLKEAERLELNWHTAAHSAALSEQQDPMLFDVTGQESPEWRQIAIMNKMQQTSGPPVPVEMPSGQMGEQMNTPPEPVAFSATTTNTTEMV